MNGTIIFILVIVIVLIAAFVWWWFDKKKKKQPLFSPSDMTQLQKAVNKNKECVYPAVPTEFVEPFIKRCEQRDIDQYYAKTFARANPLDFYNIATKPDPPSPAVGTTWDESRIDTPYNSGLYSQGVRYCIKVEGLDLMSESTQTIMTHGSGLQMTFPNVVSGRAVYIYRSTFNAYSVDGVITELPPYKLVGKVVYLGPQYPVVDTIGGPVFVDQKNKL